MKIEQTTFGELETGDIFFFPTQDYLATLLVKTGNLDANDDAVVYRLVVALDSVVLNVAGDRA